MYFAINDVLQAWEQVSGGIIAFTGNRRGVAGVDYSYITPTIIALGEFSESNVEELVKVTQGDPAVIWNLGYAPV